MKKGLILIIVMLLALAGLWLYQDKYIDKQATNNDGNNTEGEKADTPITDQVLYSLNGTVASVSTSQITIRTTVVKNGIATAENRTLSINSSTQIVSPNKKTTDLRVGSTVNAFYYQKPGQNTSLITASKIELMK